MRIPRFLIACAGVCAIAATHAADHRSALGAYKAKDYPACARLYGQQADRTPPVRGAAYDTACCLALAGDSEGALSRLEATPSDLLRSHIADDADLVSLHDDPRWQVLLARYRGDMASLVSRRDDALLDELQHRIDKDQEARNRAMRDPENAAVAATLGEVDRDNTAWLKAYLAEHGWPGYDLVGRSGSQGFFLLAQHADQDPAFQEQVLVMLHDAVSRQQASGIHLAYLTDRVRLAQGKPQLYGTQFHTVDGKLQPQAIEDAEHVEARRAALGMESLAEYTANIEDMYATPAK
ncbi:DUF6624 domain-containing protein [Pseudoxanthomonas sp. PXM01]|uniref:DUF6624 domain-containing protein n=1 Tax=Pseudoxanthomonas sp. PXM01 TaxID=2769295 RepID=UPI0017824983|nr:DUF6624 domain-containing protein [Pseudoxanthomonas sp. PXM01]MBD9470834.1 hypothetical protein [Pseudoxanthomonas sp. PXM01]